MLNNKLDVLIVKYKEYKKQEFLGYFYMIIGSIITIILSLLAGSFLIDFFTSNPEPKESNIDSKKVEEVVKRELKPKIINVVKIVKIDEDATLNKNKTQTLMTIEKSKPSYASAYDLAENFYKNKNYKKTAQWAVTASNRSPKNDKAWILYAKAKLKVGQKARAKKALRIYLLKYKSQKVKNLLNSL